MNNWKHSSHRDERLYKAISLLLSPYPQTLDFLFDPSNPQLRKPAEELLFACKGLSSTEYTLTKLALDIWGGYQYTQIADLFEIEPEIFELFLKAMRLLKPQHSKLSRWFEQNVDLIFQAPDMP